jgi:hypothetical protein
VKVSGCARLHNSTGRKAHRNIQEGVYLLAAGVAEYRAEQQEEEEESYEAAEDRAQGDREPVVVKRSARGLAEQYLDVFLCVKINQRIIGGRRCGCGGLADEFILSCSAVLVNSQKIRNMSLKHFASRSYKLSSTESRKLFRHSWLLPLPLARYNCTLRLACLYFMYNMWTV